MDPHTSVLARVSRLLDEAKEELEAMEVPVQRMATCHSKITEAQNLLVGASPTNPEEN